MRTGENFGNWSLVTDIVCWILSPLLRLSKTAGVYSTYSDCLRATPMQVVPLESLAGLVDEALIQMPDQRVTGLACEDLCKFPSICQALVRCFESLAGLVGESNALDEGKSNEASASRPKPLGDGVLPIEAEVFSGGLSRDTFTSLSIFSRIKHTIFVFSKASVTGKDVHDVYLKALEHLGFNRRYVT